MYYRFKYIYFGVFEGYCRYLLQCYTIQSKPIQTPIHHTFGSWAFTWPTRYRVICIYPIYLYISPLLVYTLIYLYFLLYNIIYKFIHSIYELNKGRLVRLEPMSRSLYGCSQPVIPTHIIIKIYIQIKLDITKYPIYIINIY